MRRLLPLLLLAGCAAQLSEQQLHTYPDARGMPAAVQAFIVRYEGCQHFAGEEPYDEERRRFLAKNIDALCPGIDALAARLRARYRDDPAVSARLARYEAIGT